MRSLSIPTILGFAGTALSASKLLSGGTIVAFDEESKSLNVIRDGSLFITDDRITGLYDKAAPKGLPADTEIVDCQHKIITPGFIDTHRHGWQTGMKTLASNTTLAEYMYKWGPGGGGPIYTAEDVYIGQLAGLLEAINAGVTTTLDHAHNLWDADRAVAGLDASIESGARVAWAPALTPFSGPYSVADQIEDWKSWKAKKLKADGLVTLGLAYDNLEHGSPKDNEAFIKLMK